MESPISRPREPCVTDALHLVLNNSSNSMGVITYINRSSPNHINTISSIGIR